MSIPSLIGSPRTPHANETPIDLAELESLWTVTELLSEKNVSTIGIPPILDRYPKALTKLSEITKAFGFEDPKNAPSRFCLPAFHLYLIGRTVSFPLPLSPEEHITESYLMAAEGAIEAMTTQQQSQAIARQLSLIDEMVKATTVKELTAQDRPVPLRRSNLRKAKLETLNRFHATRSAKLGLFLPIFPNLPHRHEAQEREAGSLAPAVLTAEMPLPLSASAAGTPIRLFSEEQREAAKPHGEKTAEALSRFQQTIDLAPRQENQKKAIDDLRKSIDENVFDYLNRQFPLIAKKFGFDGSPETTPLILYSLVIHRHLLSTGQVTAGLIDAYLTVAETAVEATQTLSQARKIQTQLKKLPAMIALLSRLPEMIACCERFTTRLNNVCSSLLQRLKETEQPS